MSLCADPPILNASASGGHYIHKLITGGPQRIMFKLKCSNNADYRINPVWGFIDGYGSTDIAIDRSAGPPREDKIIIMYAFAPADATNAHDAFVGLKEHGRITMPISAI